MKMDRLACWQRLQKNHSHFPFRSEKGNRVGASPVPLVVKILYPNPRQPGRLKLYLLFVDHGPQ